MENMFEHSIALKAIALIGKGIIYLGIVFGFVPFFDFIVLQVDQHIFISPYTKILLDEIKLVLTVITTALVLVRVIIGIVKPTNEKK